jgi:uncharacterized protein YdhG (YjbR/CyaY superfamily)
MGSKTIVRNIFALAFVSLSLSCVGTAPGVNSERLNVISAQIKQPEVKDTETVSITTEILDIQGTLVKGTSCQNKLWDPAPTKERAILLMKRQANEMGFSHIHSVRTQDDQTALLKNCWSAILAFGTAYNAPQEETE